MSFKKDLCDLGASVILMPLTICEKLDLGSMKPIGMTMHLEDRSIKYHVGIVEDVPKDREIVHLYRLCCDGYIGRH